MQIVFRAVSVAAGGAILILVFRDVDFSAMYSRIVNVGYYFIPIYAVYGIGCLLDTAAWKIILTTPYKTISFSKLFQIHVAGESMYRFIPVGVVVGEAAKIFLLTKQSRFESPEAVSSLVIRKLLMGLSQGMYIGLGVLLGNIAFARERKCSACFRRRFCGSARCIFIDRDQTFTGVVLHLVILLFAEVACCWTQDRK